MSYLDTPSVVTVEIAGVDRSSLVEGRGSQLSLQLRANNQNPTGNITIKSDGSWRPVCGQPIVVKEDGTELFTGTLETVKESRIVAGPSAGVYLKCTITGLAARLAQITFIWSFEAMTTGAIARYIMEHWANSGVFPTEAILYGTTGSGGYIDDGVMVEGPLPFDGSTIADALDYLADFANKIWWVDAQRNLHMQDRTAIAAPFSITDATPNCTSIEVGTSRSDYVNASRTKLNFYTEHPVHSFMGDGSTREFDLSPYAPAGLALVDGLSLNGTDITDQLGQVGSGSNYTWAFGGRKLIQDSSLPVLHSTDTLAVAFRFLGSDWLASENLSAISARASVEGNTGRYERLYSDDTHQFDEMGAQDAADAAIVPTSVIPTVLTIGTEGPVAKPRPGMLISIDLDTPLVSGDFLVQDVSATFQSGIGFRYSATAIDGRRVPNFIDFFKSLASGGGGRTAISGGGVSGGGGAANLVLPLTLSDPTTNITSPATPIDGQALLVVLTQDSTGGRLVTWASEYKFAPTEIGTLGDTVTVCHFMGQGGSWWLSGQPLTGM